MEQQNMQSLGETRWRRRLRYAMVVFMVLFPVLLSLLAAHESYSLDGDKYMGQIKLALDNSKLFLTRKTAVRLIDITGFTLALGREFHRVLIQGNFCLIAGIIFLRYALRKKQTHLYPLAIVNSVYSLFVFSALFGDYLLAWEFTVLYNRFMLWGRYLRDFRGVLPIVIYPALAVALLYYLIADIRKNRK